MSFQGQSDPWFLLILALCNVWRLSATSTMTAVITMLLCSDVCNRQWILLYVKCIGHSLLPPHGGGQHWHRMVLVCSNSTTNWHSPLTSCLGKLRSSELEAWISILLLYGHHNAGRQKLNLRYTGGYGPLDFLETWIEVGLYGYHLRHGVTIKFEFQWSTACMW